MIEEFEALRERARVAVARGDHDAARLALLSAARKTDTPEREYLTILRPLSNLLANANDPRGALTVVCYLASNDSSHWKRAFSLFAQVPAEDRARVLAARGQTPEAAREAESAGRVASAALYREAGGDWAGARALWARLASKQRDFGSSRGTTERECDEMYVAALVGFNLARCARQCGDERQSREASIACVQTLEEAADRFESMGQRERAFDCFQVLAHVGLQLGAFEDVLEGFVNCIRILRQDHMKRFALKHYQEAIRAAADRGEASAGATLAKEAAEYARSIGLDPLANDFTWRQAELWRISARQHVDRGAPAQVSESALLASILAFGEVGQGAQVRQNYAELAKLALDAGRREHYARAEQRYARMKDEPLEREAIEDVALREGVAGELGEVWRVDVVEWERAGCASEVCADAMLDRLLPEFIRRNAMLARLTALQVEESASDTGRALDDLRVRLAEQLGQIQLYSVLSPLEHLFAGAGNRVKIAVLEALQTLPYKRSFVTLRAGLADSDPGVVAQAIQAIEMQQAFDPLSRLVRESADPNVRAAALRALARVDTAESAEFLQSVIDHGSTSDRAAVNEAREAGLSSKRLSSGG